MTPLAGPAGACALGSWRLRLELRRGILFVRVADASGLPLRERCVVLEPGGNRVEIGP